ncbi:MAG: hypothetical protein ACRD72_03130, partial [Candidatus Angelobacter sp.]
ARSVPPFREVKDVIKQQAMGVGMDWEGLLTFSQSAAGAIIEILAGLTPNLILPAAVTRLFCPSFRNSVRKDGVQ